MADDINKIFSDNEIVTDNSVDLDSGDIVVGDTPMPNPPEKISAKENYFQSIFGDNDIDEPSEFEKEFDKDAVYVKDESGQFVKKEDEEENPEEDEEQNQEDLLDEADELEEGLKKPRKKQAKKPVKKIQQKPIPTNSEIKKDIFETETEEDVGSPSVDAISTLEEPVKSTPFSPEFDNLDEGDSLTEELIKEQKKPNFSKISKNYEAEIPTNDEIPAIEKVNYEENVSVSPEETKSESAYIDTSVEDATDEITNTVSHKKKAISQMSTEEISRLTPEEINSLSASEKRELLEKTDDSKVLERKEYISGIKNAEELRDNNVIDIDEKSPATPIIHNSNSSISPNERATHAEDKVNTESEFSSNPQYDTYTEDKIDKYTPNAVNDITHNTTPDTSMPDTLSKDVSAPSVVYAGNQEKAAEFKKEFSLESFQQDLQSNTGFSINVVDKGDNFEVNTVSQTFTLNKSSGEVIGDTGALGAIIGKTYEQYDPITAKTPAKTYEAAEKKTTIQPPMKVDTWSAEKVIEGFNGKYGAVTASKNKNGNVVLSFPEQSTYASFSVELNNSHVPIAVNNSPDFIKDVIDNIYQQNQNIASVDNAEFIRQRTIYNDEIKKQQAEVSRPVVPYYVTREYNPNGYSKKIGDGYNFSLETTNSAPQIQSRIFTNPYLSNELHPSVIAGYRNANASLNKPVMTASQPSVSYTRNIYQDFVDFKKNLSSDRSYVDKAYSNAQKHSYNTENSKPAPIPFVDLSKVSEKSTLSPTPFIHSSSVKEQSAQAVKRVQTYGSALNPIYNINSFSQYNFLRDTQQFVSRAGQTVSRPLINTVKSTISSTEIGEGSRKLTGYIAAPVLIGAYAAYKNIWQTTNTKAMLERTSQKARSAVSNRLNNAGVSFKLSSELNSINGIQRIQKSIATRGRVVGVDNINKLKFADLQIVKKQLRNKIITYNGKKIDFATAKSIARHLGDKTPVEITKWLDQYRVVDSAIAVQTYLDSASGEFLNRLGELNIIKKGEKFDLTDLRDIQMLQRKLAKYANDKGFGNLSTMSIKKLIKWIELHQGEESASIAELFKLLRDYQKKARRLNHLKFSRFFTIMQLAQSIMSNNEILQGGFMMYRTVHSAIMATKATIRFIKTSRRFLGAMGKRVRRFATRTHLDVPVTAVKKIVRNAGHSAATLARRSYAGSRIANSVNSIKSTNLAQRAILTKNKFKSTAPLRKARFKKFALDKPKWATAAISKVTQSKFWQSLSSLATKISGVTGDLFIGAAIGIAIVVGVTAILAFTGEIAINFIDKMTVYSDEFSEVYGGGTELEKLYADLEEQDKAFMQDMENAGSNPYPEDIYGYYDLNQFKNNKFSLYKIPNPGDVNAPDGSLNKIGYEYHLYDRLLDGTRTPEEIGAKEIPFESNAKELLSCGNTIFYTDSFKENTLIKQGNSQKQVGSKKIMKDYCLDGTYFKDSDGTPHPLWTATHGYFLKPSEIYTCSSGTGCAEYHYLCGKQTARTSSSNNYLNVAVTENTENKAFYSLYENRNANLRIFGAPVPQQAFGCKQHNKNNTSASYTNTVEYEYYCGLSHLSSDGKCYVCSKENSTRTNIGHTQKVYKIRDCNEQKLVFETKSKTFINETKDNAKATFSDFKAAYNTAKKGSKLDSYILDNLYVINSNIKDNRGNVINGLTLKGWVYATTEKDGNDVRSLRAYIKKNVCNSYKEVCSTEKVWISPIRFINIYIYAFYCPGHSNCSHYAYQYDKKTISYTYTITDNTGEKYEVELNKVPLIYECNKVTRTNQTVNVSIPHFECVGYCDGHNIKYCKGHYNNIINGYIVKSMDNTFSIYCKNPKCSLYGIEQKNMVSNMCSGYINGTREKCEQLCQIKNMNPNSVFYADNAYGPTSIGNMPDWGKLDYSNRNNHSTLGWFETFRGADRMTLAKTKLSVDWYNVYGITTASSENSTHADASEIDKLLNLSDYKVLSNGTARKDFVSFALHSTGKIPYYEGGAAVNLSYNGNNFGEHTTVSDKRGRTLVGLDGDTWITWAYASAKNQRSLLSRSVNTNNIIGFGVLNGYSNVKAGDIIVLPNNEDGSANYGIFVGMAEGNKLCVVQEIGDPTNNVTVKYYSSAQGYIPFENALR